MSTITTRQQRFAENAFSAVSHRKAQGRMDKEYAAFAKRLPALIQSAGLCQAIAFAEAKGKDEHGVLNKASGRVLTDLIDVCGKSAELGFPTTQFADRVRTEPVTGYFRLSRLALEAATWLKRYVESLENAQDSADTPDVSLEGGGA
jgi:CRISPR-associated protein Cmr5